MTTATPLIFRPSVAQRTLAALLCAGSWIVGVRALVLLLQNLPRMQAGLKVAQASGEPTFWLWVGLGAALAACVVGGGILCLSILGLLLVEGSQVLVDEMGLAVDHGGLPGPMARRMGAGRLAWKEIRALEKGRLFFVIRGGDQADNGEAIPLKPPPVLRFLIVDELERLILLILERSPNLRLEE